MTMATEEFHKRVPAIERHVITTVTLILMAVLLWVGNTVQQTAVEVAAMRVQITYLQTQVATPEPKFARIEARLDAIEKELAHLNRDRNDVN